MSYFQNPLKSNVICQLLVFTDLVAQERDREHQGNNSACHKHNQSTRPLANSKSSSCAKTQAKSAYFYQLSQPLSLIKEGFTSTIICLLTNLISICKLTKMSPVQHQTEIHKTNLCGK